SSSARPTSARIRATTSKAGATGGPTSGAPGRSGGRCRGRGSAGIPDDLPEMAVQVSEVAGIDPPRSFVWRSDARAGGLRLSQELVDFGAAPDELAEAELAALRTPAGDPCVLCEVAARVETEEQPAVELEQGDGAVGAGSLVGPLATDD